MLYPTTDAQLSASNLQVLLHFLADDAARHLVSPSAENLLRAEASGNEFRTGEDVQKHEGER